MTKFLLTIAVVVSCFLSTLKAQKRLTEVQPLHLFLQANADTTVVFEVVKRDLDPIRYLIISKKGDTLTCYTYQDLIYEYGSIIPKNIRRTMVKNKKMNLWDFPVDVNDFFNPYPMDNSIIQRFWAKLMSIHPWTVRDDTLDGEGCSNHYVVDDASTVKLFLITKNEIRVLKFYGLEEFEELCPGRAGRISMRKINRLFNQYMNSVSNIGIQPDRL